MRTTSSRRQLVSTEYHGVLAASRTEQPKARPTTYSGIHMRSRTEARYAEYLDKLGIAWEYEPMCYANSEGQYLPDFVLHTNKRPIYVEIKPTNADAQTALGLMHTIRDSQPNAVLMVVIPDGLRGFTVARGCHNINVGNNEWRCDHEATTSSEPAQLTLQVAA